MKKLLLVIPVLVLLLIIKNNISGIVRTLEDENTAENLKEKLVSEQKKNKFLKEHLFYVKTNQFVEKEAREKLLMSRPGEYVVIAPTASPLDQEKIEIDTRPNWQKWWSLFF